MNHLILVMSRNRRAASASLALALMALQFAALRWSPDDVPVRVMLPLTIALVPVALWPLRDYAGIWVMFVGLAANLAVILANGGLMPIERATVVAAVGEERAAEYAAGEWIRGSKDVLVKDGEGRALALADSIIVRAGGGGFAASPGDLVVWCGLLVLVAEASWRWQRSRRPLPAAGVRGAGGGAPTPR